jgi:hypothetical protein
LLFRNRVRLVLETEFEVLLEHHRSLVQCKSV